MKNLFQHLITLSLIMACIGCNLENGLVLEQITIYDETETPGGADFVNIVSVDPQNICGDKIEKRLITGRGNFIAGTILISNDQDQIYFEFIPIEGWSVTEINIHIGDLSEMPVVSSHNPDYSEFAFLEIYTPPLPEVTFPIGIQELTVGEDGKLTIVAHAKITNSSDDPVVKSVLVEWDDDLLFLGPRKGGGFLYEIQSCETDRDASGTYDEILTDPLCVDPVQLDLLNKQKDPEKVDILGMINLSTDDENMIFDFSLIEDWKVESIHVNVGEFKSDQYNPVGNVPVGRYDFNSSFEPAEPATSEDPLAFEIPLIEIENDLEEGCGLFFIQATISREIIEDGIVILTETQAVSVAWSNNLSASNRPGRGSLSRGSKGGRSVKPAGVELCMITCPVE